MRRFFVEAGQHYRAAADRAGDAAEAGHDLRHAADAALIVSDGRAAVDLLLLAAERARIDPGNARAAAIGDAALIASALDALGIAVLRRGHRAEALHIAEERLEVVSSLSIDDPTGAAEITEAFQVARSAAVAAGDLPAARAAIRRARVRDPVADHPYLSRPRRVRVLALSGRFFVEARMPSTPLTSTAPTDA